MLSVSNIDWRHVLALIVVTASFNLVDNSGSKKIEKALAMNLYEKGHSPISTHVTGCGLAECDVISISKADFIYEYEVKISKSDFKADFKKKKHKLMTERKSVNESKNFYFIANYFYFVVPENLISIDDIPEYAGLIYLCGDKFKQIKKGFDFSQRSRGTYYCFLCSK